MPDDLTARLETATEGSREMDARIENHMARGSDKDLAYILEDVERITRPPFFTTSLDAALTLVPEGWYWSVTVTSLADYTGPMAFCWKSSVANIMQHGASPALALCIAALKARAAEEKPDA